MKKIIELKLDPVSRRIIKSYLLILLLVGLMLLALPFWLHLEERPKQSLSFQQFSVQLEQRYQLRPEQLNRYQCYEGQLHYWNKGAFSGLLQKLPPISCNEQEFEALKMQLFYAQHPVNWLIALIGVVLILLPSFALFKLHQSPSQE